MGKTKLDYRIHNPNPTAVTADHLLKVLIEVNMKKAESALRKAAERATDAETQIQEDRLACPMRKAFFLGYFVYSSIF